MPTIKSLGDDEGDIIIEGYAADYEPDRQNEAFLEGAFDEAIEKANRDGLPLLDEHDNKRVLGAVERLEDHGKGKGLWMRARIFEPMEDWSRATVKAIQRGAKRMLSVRGRSRGVYTPDGPRIAGIDLAEISTTSVGVQPGALFAVAQKSLAYAEGEDDSSIAWAVEGWADVKARYTDQEIADALEAHYKRRFSELQQCFEKAHRILADIPTYPST